MALKLKMNREEIDRLQTSHPAEVCHSLAMKVRRFRQDAKLSQAEFARQAEIPLRTYKRFESHGRANLETFIRALRTMGRTQYLCMLFPASQFPRYEGGGDILGTG